MAAISTNVKVFAFNQFPHPITSRNRTPEISNQSYEHELYNDGHSQPLSCQYGFEAITVANPMYENYRTCIFLASWRKERDRRLLRGLIQGQEEHMLSGFR